MIYPPQPPVPLVQDWIERHRDPRSFVLHMLGIPGTILGVLLMPIYVMLMSVPLFLFALVLFVGGYLLQFLGHALDGTEPGEIKALRIWWLGVAREAAAGAGSQSPSPDRGRADRPDLGKTRRRASRSGRDRPRHRAGRLAGPVALT